MKKTPSERALVDSCCRIINLWIIVCFWWEFLRSKTTLLMKLHHKNVTHDVSWRSQHLLTRVCWISTKALICSCWSAKCFNFFYRFLFPMCFVVGIFHSLYDFISFFKHCNHLDVVLTSFTNNEISGKISYLCCQETKLSKNLHD